MLYIVRRTETLRDTFLDGRIVCQVRQVNSRLTVGVQVSRNASLLGC